MSARAICCDRHQLGERIGAIEGSQVGDGPQSSALQQPLDGTSRRLPVMVCGRAATATTSSGTWRGETSDLIRLSDSLDKLGREFVAGDRYDEQGHQIAAIRLLDADHERVGDFRELVDDLVDLGTAHPDAVPVRRSGRGR